MTAEQRILSVWWPHLAIERWAKSSDVPPDKPVVLTIDGTHGLVISAVTKAAAESGARVGARLTDARALDPALVAVPADPAGDEALVERLARWASRWSPLVEADGRDGLRLDITGVAHLFGGEAALVEDVRKRFAALGLSSRVAVAPTPAAAWALARFGKKTLTLPLRGPSLSRARERVGVRVLTFSLPSPSPRCGWDLKPSGRSNGSGSRPSARWRQCRAGRSRGASARPTIRWTRSTERLAASPSR